MPTISSLVDKFLDEIRDKIVDYVMKQGKKLGGPFIGGDEETTRKLLELALDARKWAQAPYKVVLIASNPTKTVDAAGDTPGADPATQSSRPHFFSEKDFEQPPRTDVPPSKQDNSSDRFQPPDREFVRGHADHHGRAKDAPSPLNAEGHTSKPAAQPASPPESGQQQSTGGGQPSLPPQPDIVLGPDGQYHTEPPAAPAAAPPAARPTPASHEGGRSGDRDPMGGSREIGHGADKPDHNTPGGRDVGSIG